MADPTWKPDPLSGYWNVVRTPRYSPYKGRKVLHYHEWQGDSRVEHDQVFSGDIEARVVFGSNPTSNAGFMPRAYTKEGETRQFVLMRFNAKNRVTLYNRDVDRITDQIFSDKTYERVKRIRGEAWPVPFEFKVRIKGGTVTGFVNGEEIGSIETNYPSGEVWLMSHHGFADRARAWFSEVEVKRL